MTWAGLEEAREALDARFEARFAEARVYLAGRRWPSDGPVPRLPRLVRDTIAWASRLDGGVSFERLARCYCDELVTGFVAQLLGGDDPTVELLWWPLEAARAPRLAGALAGMAGALEAAGISATAHLGRAWPLAPGASAASLYVATVFGSGTPMPWSATGWWRAAPQPLDEELFASGLAALFIGHQLVDGVVEAVPARVPEDTVWIDAAACRADVGQRLSGDAFGPGSALVPPPIARLLVARGRTYLTLTASSPAEAAAQARALVSDLR